MATMNFSIPDEVKERFNRLFKTANKSAIATRALLREIEAEERRLENGDFVERMRKMRARSPGFTAEQIRKAREEGRP